MPLTDEVTGEPIPKTDLNMPFLTSAMSKGIKRVEQILAEEKPKQEASPKAIGKRRHDFDDDAESADDGDYMTDAPPLHVGSEGQSRPRLEDEEFYETYPSAYAPEEILSAAIASAVDTITNSFDKQEGRIYQSCSKLISVAVDKRTELIAKAQQDLISAVRADLDSRLPTLTGFVTQKEYEALYDTITKINAELTQLRAMVSDRRKIDQGVLDSCTEILKRCKISEILRAEKDTLEQEINDKRRDLGLTPTELPVRESIASVKKAVLKDLGTLGVASSSTSVPFVPSSSSSNPHGTKLATKRQQRPSGF